MDVFDESKSKWIYTDREAFDPLARVCVCVCVVDNDVDQSRCIVSHVDHISLSMNTILRGGERVAIALSNTFERLLFLSVPPRIISHSPEQMHLTVREGRDAQFSCMAFGRPIPVIVWHVNGLSRPATVTTSTSRARQLNWHFVTPLNLIAFLVAGKNESILVLRNLSRFDSGRVDCSARNTLSTVNRQFLLHVKCKFQFFTRSAKRHPDREWEL